MSESKTKIDKDWKFNCSLCAVPVLTFLDKVEAFDMCWKCTNVATCSKTFLENGEPEDVVSAHNANFWEICSLYYDTMLRGKFIDPKKKVWHILRDRVDLEPKFLPDNNDPHTMAYLGFILNSGYFCIGYDMLGHMTCDINDCTKEDVGNVIRLCKHSKDPNAKMILKIITEKKSGKKNS